MMSYKDALAKMIKKSGLSLRAVADRCSAMQVSVSASYLSQLQTGKLLPPNEEVSRAIAQVCGGNANDLILLGYLDRAPEIVKEYFFAMSNLNRDMYKALNKESQFKQDSKIIEQMDEIQRLFSSISIFEKFKRAASFKTDLDYYEIVNGEVFLKYEKLGGEEYDFMEDDSMEPLIPQNALLKFEQNTQLQNGDIVRATYGKKPVVRQYQKEENIVLLIPKNSKYHVSMLKENLDTVLFEKLVLYQKAID